MFTFMLARYARSQVPAFLQQFEHILHSATCWLGDAQSWIGAPYAYTTAKSLHSHAKSLQVCLTSCSWVWSAGLRLK